MERAAPPPPPAPPPPAPPGTPPGTPGAPPGIERVLREALRRAGRALGEDGGLRELLRRRRDRPTLSWLWGSRPRFGGLSLEGAPRWLLVHRPVPPLIQDGPQCGLVALCMAAPLLGPPRARLGLGALLETARARGYTRHGEMFSAAQLAALAQELLPCRAELLQGGLGGPNRVRLLRHLLGGRPLLVPYDGDRNHSPCCCRGHRAHWALLNGVLLPVPPRLPLGPQFQRDPEIPNVFHARGAPLGEGAALFGEGAALLGEGEVPFGEGAEPFGEGTALFGEGSPAERVPGLGRGSRFGGPGEESQLFEEGSQAEAGSPLGEGSPGAVPELGWGSPLGEGSRLPQQADLGLGSCSDLGPGSRCDLGSQADLGLGSRLSEEADLGLGSRLSEEADLGLGSRTDLGLGSGVAVDSGPGSRCDPGPGSRCDLGLGSRCDPGPGSRCDLGLGSRCDSGPGSRCDLGLGAGCDPGPGSRCDLGLGAGCDLGPGSRCDSGLGSRCDLGLGAGPLVLALQGRSPRPQLWALRALAASNAQLGELSPRRWGGGFVLPPGGLAGGLRGRAVLLHPLQTPPQ